MFINNLLFISLSPVLIIALYIYSRDKYEREPLPVLLRAMLAGIAIVLPVIIIEKILSAPSEEMEGISYAAYNAFIVAGFTEEAFKYFAFYLFFWRNKNFNEKFDGIIYAVYIALGFAAVENIFYVFSGGVGVGMVRAVTAVPAHALFGVTMGYYFSLAKFNVRHNSLFMAMAFIMPFLFHGLYDFVLMSQSPVMLVLFIPLFIYFWISGFRKISVASDESSFRDNITGDMDSGKSGTVL
jgi:RsiW-degrading membrane proteinase PrsW (M82 family)